MKEKNKESRQQCRACADIQKMEDRVLVRLEMPGVSKDDLKVQVKSDLLIVEGKKKMAPAKGNVLVREILDADYYHEFTIDKTIDPNTIDAVMEAGVLTLTLSLRESEKPKTIAITAK